MSEQEKNVVELKPRPTGEALRIAFFLELRATLKKLQEYYGEEPDTFSAHVEAAREGEIGIGGAVNQLKWARNSLAIFESIQNKNAFL